jgi:hypothetical protein
MSLGYLLEMHGATRGVPQKSFSECFKEANLKGTKFNEDAARLIQDIHKLEGTSRELLGVTWMNENSDFSLRPMPNPNGHPEDIMRWDVGPFHINIYYTIQAIEKKEVSMQGLIIENVFGYNFYSDVAGTIPAAFTGVPLENGRMAARRLNAMGGNDEDRATNYTKPSSRPHRRKSYKTYAPRFKAFFECYYNPQRWVNI